MQIVVHRQSLEDNLNRYARYAHDLCKICAKDPPTAVGDRHLCKWASRSAAVSHNWGPAPCVAGKLGSQPPDSDVCRGEMGQTPESILVSAHPDHLCIVLAIEQHFDGKQCKAKPTNAMQISQMSHIDNASSLRPCQVDCAHIFTDTLLH